MFRNLLFFLIALFITTQARCEIDLVKNGQSEYKIYLSTSAVAAEKTAAERLQFYISEVTGCKLQIINELPEKSGKTIFVGPSPYVKKTLKNVNWDTLGRDGIIIRTSGADLIIAGGQPRGTLYAVYTFLEDFVGCKWWSSNESTIPQKPSLKISKVDIVYKPKLYYRDILYADIFKNPEFLVAMKLNGTYMNLPEKWGGCMEIVGWCHTFYRLLPPSKYFAKHPEWYSEINGKRTTHLSQLCLTNEEMRKEMTRIVLEKLRQNPNVDIISISQNDSPGGYCECSKCKSVDAKEGSPSGALLRFVNAIAEEVEKEFPHVMVETLAYQYSRVPPKYVKPRKNVIIRLCAGSGCCYDKPFDSKYNLEFRNTFKHWSKKCTNLFAWDYVTNFAETMVPHPNMRTLAPNIRFLVKNNAVGIFEEGDHWSTMGDFVRLRAWVISHLLWQPSADERKLIVEFMNGYYGDAGPYLIKYLDLVHDAIEREGVRLTSSGSDLAYMGLEDMNTATALFDAAEKAVKNDPKLLYRVQRERVPLTYLWILRYPDLKKLADMKKEKFMGPKDPLVACTQMKKIAEKDGSYYRDGDPMTSFFERFEKRIPLMLRVATDVPEVCKGLKQDQWLDIQNGRFLLQCDGINVEDKIASDGNAARMGGDHGDWSILCPVSTDWLRMFPKRLWRIYAVVRCDVKKNRGDFAFTMGIFDYEKFKDVIAKRIRMDQVKDGQYHIYDLGLQKLNSNCGFYFAPASNRYGIKNIYVDRIIMIPVR